jgi:2-polyprenyl-3-methyl-5-hydroxy-6-metoxy-1,4-benzoquinol methylase
MVVRIDPANNEIRALNDLVDFSGKRVLEIGSGDGRLTWRYAGSSAHVTAIEPFSDTSIEAQKNLPGELHGRIEFINRSFEEFAAACQSPIFDIAILSWSL